jgi:hypothetical protein
MTYLSRNHTGPPGNRGNDCAGRCAPQEDIRIVIIEVTVAFGSALLFGM